MNRRLSTCTVLAALVVAGTVTAAPPVWASTACSFTVAGTVMSLKSNCTTSVPIVVPDSFTLDGRHHTVTAVDPGGHFDGGVITNGGTSATVKNVTIVGNAASATCGAGLARFRGVFLINAWGTVTGTTVQNINDGAGSTCAEGNGIVIENGPYDGTHPSTHAAVVSNNHVTGFQEFGITVEGDLTPTITHNTLDGDLGTSPSGGRFGIVVVGTTGGTVASNSVNPEYNGLVDGTGVLATDTTKLVVNAETVGGYDFGVVLQSVCESTVQTSTLNTVKGSTFNAPVGSVASIYLVAQDTATTSCSPHVDTNTVSTNTINAAGGTYGVEIITATNGFTFTPSADRDRDRVLNNTINQAANPIGNFGTHTKISGNIINP